MKKRIQQNNEGFSLIELIIAVVILAFVVAPILGAFVSSARTNGKSQRVLSATTAGQNIMEEVKGTALKTLLKDEGDKTVDDTHKASGQYVITYKNQVVGGNKYTVTATLDAQEYKKAEGESEKVYQFNDKEQAQIFAMNSSYDGAYMPIKNAAKVAADTFADTNAADYMKKKTVLSIEKSDDGHGGKILSAQISIEYTYGAKPPYRETTNSYIYRDASGKDDNLRALYIFFDPLYNNGAATAREEIIIRNKSLVPVTVYLVKQEDGTPDAALEETYRVDVKVDEPLRLKDWTDVSDYKPLTTIRTNLKFDKADSSKWQIQLNDMPGAATASLMPAEAFGLSTLEHKVVEDKLYKVEVVVKDEDGNELAKMEGTKDR